MVKSWFTIKNYIPNIIRIIEKFYNDKISEMDAWFYWYSLADAQIKANKFEEASKSIQKGISVAEKIPMLDVAQEFNDLTERLENKRKFTTGALLEHHLSCERK